MRVPLRDLPGVLNKKLPALLWLSGEDLFLIDQARKDVIRVAERQGFELERLHIAGALTPSIWHGALQSSSLFSPKRLILLTLDSKEALKWLDEFSNYLESKNPDLALVIFTGKIASASLNQARFKKFEAHSEFVYVPVWPLDREQLPTFLGQQARRHELSLSPELAFRLAELTEGNLFAADQLLEKLALCVPGGRVSEALFEEMVGDHARFEIFDLTSAILAGSPERIFQVWKNLEAQKMEPVLILWALMKEFRLLASFHEQQKHSSLAELCKQQKFWEKRAKEVGRGLMRFSYENCLSLIQKGAAVDRVIKGVDPGDPYLLIQSALMEIIQCIKKGKRPW